MIDPRDVPDLPDDVKALTAALLRKLPTAAELTGSDPNFTGDESTDEYIARIRGRVAQ